MVIPVERESHIEHLKMKMHEKDVCSFFCRISEGKIAVGEFIKSLKRQFPILNMQSCGSSMLHVWVENKKTVVDIVQNQPWIVGGKTMLLQPWEALALNPSNQLSMEVERVQYLAFKGLSELPAQFIRSADERPENSKAIEGVNVPVISLSQPREVLIDHQISPLLLGRLQHVGEEFFKLSQQEKERYANDPSNGEFEGYGTKMTRNHEEKVEWIDYYFHLMYPPSKVNYQTWPQDPPSYREVTEEYTKEVLTVMDRILELLSEGLGVEGKTLKSSLGGEEMELGMKINMYPPCPQPQLALGVEPHTDMSALTILIPNDVPGLQVYKEGNWVAVNSLPNALFVHVGDQIEVLSNGKYKSVLHRSLVNKELTRMSWAVFCTPFHEALIGPLPQLVNDQKLSKYSTKSYAEFRYRKFNKLPQ